MRRAILSIALVGLIAAASTGSLPLAEDTEDQTTTSRPDRTTRGLCRHRTAHLADERAGRVDCLLR